MPKVPTFLQGVRSFKLRSLLIQLNGVCGIATIKHRGRTVGLTFDCSVAGGCPGDLTWACRQAGWECSAAAVGTANRLAVSSACTMYGRLEGYLELKVGDDGALSLAVDLQAEHPADSVLG